MSVSVGDMRPGDRVMVNGIPRIVVGTPYADRWIPGRFNVLVTTPDLGVRHVLWGDSVARFERVSD